MESTLLALESKALKPRPHVFVQATDFPLGLLDHRQFELLAYHVLDAEKSETTEYDHVALLNPGPDKGRDILLYCGGIQVGLVQCKRVQRRVGITQLIGEAVKVALHLIRDPSLLPNPSGCRYEIWSAGGFTEEARAFLDDPTRRREFIARDTSKLVSIIRAKYANSRARSKRSASQR
ncbi:hypothetical protein ABOZ73_15720 [Caulobacter sp. 73W]|uniref:Restriction endonuclease type IV Mrr domain-containing protein n=1 Tax=Caulobacter sp. 73W TaxID=3161137 RepID=A0AB39KR72_9CAUL